MKTLKPYLSMAAGALCVALSSLFLVPLLGEHAGLAGVALAAATLITDRPLSQMKTDLAKLLTELAAGQKEIEAKGVTEARGAELEAKADEALALQATLDFHARTAGILAKGREVVDPALPAGPEPKGGEHQIAGYMTPGEYFTASKEYSQWAAAGASKHQAAVVTMPILINGMVPITKAQREVIEQKAVPTVGTGVIEPQRIADVARVTEQDRLTLRDVVNMSRTGSDAVSYIRIESYTSAAAPVAAAAAKPESTLELTEQTATVRTLAVWIPVTTQQLSDVPNLRNLIDNELTYDLRRVEENQMLYGAGTGQNFLGITNTSGIIDITALARYAGGDSIIDKVRYGVTEVTSYGFEPNAAVFHPRDWESVVLKKGSDSHYVWVIVTEGMQSRIWGLRVVETNAAEEISANTTEERNVVVGDFRRGATLWMREDISVQVGMQADDFIKNKRTILAEERAAFAVTRPKAFATLKTVTAVA